MATPDEPYPWLETAAVLDQLRLMPIRVEVEAAAVERARVAAGEAVERVRRDLAGPAGAFAATPAVVQAGVLLAARCYARSGSPLGVASFGEFATAVLRSDPDVPFLLGIGRHAKPAIG